MRSLMLLLLLTLSLVSVCLCTSCSAAGNRKNVFTKYLFINSYDGEDGDDFQYGNDTNGPARWPVLYPQCAGTNQSPINITLPSLKFRTTRDLCWSRSYGQVPHNITIINNGVTVAIMASYRNASPPSLSGGTLRARYVLEEIHFHWGTVNSRGGEHTINGKRFPMEIHAVHLKENLTMEQARRIPDGIVVVGYFVEIAKDDQPALNLIRESFGFVGNNPGVEGQVAGRFALNELAAPFCRKYVTYSGSLTTPPCSQSVIWILSPYTVGVSSNQLDAFRSLYSSTKSLEDNYRPTQALNGRPVYLAV